MENRNFKLLYIDDNPDNLTTLKALVSDTFPDVKYLSALDGETGIELARAEDPDVILLDILMPVIEGFEVCKRLKADPKLKDIPVVFITAMKSDRESRIRALETGAEAFLTKPIDPLELHAQIMAMVKIKNANIERNKENTRLFEMVEIKTRELKNTYLASLNLLQDLKSEIDAKEKSQEKLRDREEILSDIFQNVSDSIILTKLSGKILSMNESFENISGIPAKDLVGKNILELAKDKLSIKQFKKIHLLLSSLMKGKDIDRFEFAYKDFILEVDAVINKKTNRVIGVVRDITERKKAEIALHESEERFRRLAENAFDGIFLLNGTCFNYVNERFCEMTGYTKKELTSPDFNFDALLSGLDSKKVLDTSNDQNQGNSIPGTYEYQLLTKKGTLKTTEISRVNIGKRDEIVLVGIVRDITERKNMETQIIQTERLSALGEMAAGMAHEISQPLNTLSFRMDNMLLEATQSHSITEDYLVKKSKKIFQDIQRIQNLIDHVREFSRSQHINEHSLFKTNDSIFNALSMVSEQYKMHNIELSIDLGKDLPQVDGNTFKFEQVILNLLVNAKDALLEKKIRLKETYPMFVKISSRLRFNHILVEVEDNGNGIKPEHMKKVLQPFFTTKETGKGTGLGLSITYGLIKEMNGTLDIQSEYLMGCKATIKLPLSQGKNRNDK